MKRLILLVAFGVVSFCAAAQSSVSVSGWARLGIVKGNHGTAPVDMNPATGTHVNDNISNITFSGKEDLGGGLYAGFNLSHFTSMDVGGAGSSPFWANRSVLKLGGSFGELYMGRAMTPAAWMVLFYDPWYWDGSPAQVGWGIQQANYYATSGLRTNNTVGYTSPSFGGFNVALAVAAGEGTVPRNAGASLTYAEGPLSLGLAHDQHKASASGGSTDSMTILAAAYDFGVARPMATYTSSKVAGVRYASYSLAATVPAGPAGLVQLAFARLDDFETATAQKESLQRLSLGYQHSLSKRTKLYSNLSQSRADTRTNTQSLELGIHHDF
jgi:predicted porin